MELPSLEGALKQESLAFRRERFKSAHFILHLKNNPNRKNTSGASGHNKELLAGLGLSLPLAQEASYVGYS